MEAKRPAYLASHSFARKKRVDETAGRSGLILIRRAYKSQFLPKFASLKKEHMEMNRKKSSNLLDNAVSALASLPGVGQKTALRLALYLLRRDLAYTENFAAALVALRREVRYCRVCHNICEEEICSICADPTRDRTTVCGVENLREVMAIERTGQFRGLYHVLGGILSPMDGIGPDDLRIDSLVRRAREEELKEVILALSATMEGDTTGYFIYRKIAPCGVDVSVIARGVSVGDEIEYTDEITLGRSILNRTGFAPNQTAHS
jgi:recombination protein RecR